MSGRSSRLEIVAAAAVTLVATGACRRVRLAERDPADVVKVVSAMSANVPTPGGRRDCLPHELAGGATMTARTMELIAGHKLPEHPEFSEWMNPQDLDSPAAITLASANATVTERRQAAAELMSAPFYLVYYIDHISAPMALGFKEKRLGYVAATAIRYERTGRAECVMLFNFYNDEKKQKWANDKTDGDAVDPAVQQALKDDLRYQLLALVPTLGSPNYKNVSHGVPGKPEM